MKKIIPTLLLSFIYFTSCSKDNITDFTKEQIEDTTPEEPENTIKTPCDFNMSEIKKGETITINCLLDLKGKTVILPEDVTINFNKGDIINGTLNFTGNGKIDGRLLNSSIIVKGNVKLIDPSFYFYAVRWNIKEGKVEKNVALQNNTLLEKTIFFVKKLGATKFTINKLDAYFEVNTVTSTTSDQNFYPSREGINIPSNMHLEMTENTILRVFPTSGERSGSLLSILNATDIKINGGTLYGDRELRDNSTSINKNGGSNLLNIRSGKNIIIDGVKLTKGSIGGLNINSLGFTFNSDYIPSNNITVKNCTFEKLRRMSFVITDGYNILVEGNKFIDSSTKVGNSDGGEVGFALNIEPVRTRDPNTNEFIWHQRVQDVTIRNNTETGSRIGSFNVFLGERITIENNTVESRIAWSLAYKTKIKNNTFIASERTKDSPALSIGVESETVAENEVSGNKISGYSLGIATYYGGVKIFDNEFKNNNTAIFIKENIKETEIYNNTITSTDRARGITLHLTYADKLKIYNNIISVDAIHILTTALNQEQNHKDYTISIEKNTFNGLQSSTTFGRSNGIKLSDNTIEGKIQISNSSNIDIVSNKITTNEGNGISVSDRVSKINILNNDINFSEQGRYKCINIDDVNNINEVTITNNVCKEI